MSGNGLREQELHVSAAVIRPLERFQIPEVLRFLHEERVPLAGCTASLAHATICHDASTTPQVLVLVATQRDEVCGAAVLVISRTAYWRRIWLRHPLAFCEIVVRRLTKEASLAGQAMLRALQGRETIAATNSGMLKVSQTDQRQHMIDAEGQRRWQESSPEIAKLEYIAVGSNFRRQRIGANLLTTALKLLETRGVKRLDSQISPENTRSILLHKMLGAALFKGQSTVVASFDIGRRQ